MRRILIFAFLFMTVACSPAAGENDKSEYELDPPGVRVSYPTHWVVEDVENGVIMGTDAATVDALRANETIDGGGMAISTLATSQLAAADPLDLIDVLLESFVTAGDSDWRLNGPPAEMVIDEQPAARLTLSRATPADPGIMTLTTIMGPETTILVVAVDTTEGGTHVENLNDVVDSLVAVE